MVGTCNASFPSIAEKLREHGLLPEPFERKASFKHNRLSINDVHYVLLERKDDKRAAFMFCSSLNALTEIQDTFRSPV